MGFPLIRCQKALLATGNNDAEAAMEWLFARMEDPGKPFPSPRALYRVIIAHFDACPCVDIDAPIVHQSAGSAAAAAGKGPDPSPEQISMLADMGFSPAQARKALRETVRGRTRPCAFPSSTLNFLYSLTFMAQSGDIERAVEWLFSHADDPGEEEGAANSCGNGPAQNPNNTATGTLPGSPALPARYRLRAFISHKGTSVHSGHYVAHILTERDGWVLFNDEKVVRADAESVRALKPLGYLYVFERERA
jgi:ubiquitin carboxyl-terminal hydrolase 5/13